jgi:hypothetical protein
MNEISQEVCFPSSDNTHRFSTSYRSKPLPFPPKSHPRQIPAQARRPAQPKIHQRKRAGDWERNKKDHNLLVVRYLENSTIQLFHIYIPYHTTPIARHKRRRIRNSHASAPSPGSIRLTHICSSRKVRKKQVISTKLYMCLCPSQTQKTPTLMLNKKRPRQKQNKTMIVHPQIGTTPFQPHSPQALMTSLPNRLPPCELVALLGVNPPPLSLAGVCGVVSGSKSI